ncbi:MAG: hypothetical protein ABH878_02875 [bacterium]
MRKLWLTLLLLSFSLLIALVIGEVAARIFLSYQRRTLEAKNQGNILTRPAFFEDIFAPIEPAGFTNKPNFQVEWSGVLVRTDALGCRTGRVAADSAQVILFVGDSMIFGLGLADSMTIPSLVQQYLNEAPSTRPAKVVNAGVSGYDFQQYLHQIQRLTPLLKPSLILVGIANNDLFPTEDPFGNVLAVRQGTQQEEETAVRDANLPRRSETKTKQSWLKSSGLVQLFKQVSYRIKLMAKPKEEYNVQLTESEQQAAELVDKFVASVKEYGIPCGFVYFPEHRNLGRESSFIYVRLLRDRQQSVLDLSLEPSLSAESYFCKVGKAAGGLISAQMHFNAAGSQVVSQAISRWVVEKGLWE